MRVGGIYGHLQDARNVHYLDLGDGFKSEI